MELPQTFLNFSGRSLIIKLLPSFPSSHAVAVGAINVTKDDIIGILLSMTSNDYSKYKYQCTVDTYIVLLCLTSLILANPLQHDDLDGIEQCQYVQGSWL